MRQSRIRGEGKSYYHCISRVVDRRFVLHAEEKEHFVTLMRKLEAFHGMRVVTYCVMSNHFHVVVRIDAERAAAWTTDEVLERWTALFSGPLLVQRYLEEGRSGLSAGDALAVDQLAATYRARLADLSWFMRTLNEGIARQANAEDGVKGRFWEGRFKSQALLDEQALIAALAYVDHSLFLR